MGLWGKNVKPPKTKERVRKVKKGEQWRRRLKSPKSTLPTWGEVQNKPKYRGE
jgi:hypothetical protein